MTSEEVQTAIESGQHVWMSKWAKDPLILVQLSPIRTQSMIFDALAKPPGGDQSVAVKKEWLSLYPHMVTETI